MPNPKIIPGEQRRQEKTERMPAKPKAPVPLPEWTSDRMRLLGSRVTPRVIELALLRFSDKNAFFKGGQLQVTDDKSVVKTALIVLREINPSEEWDDEEEALFTGVCSRTLRARKSDEMRQLRALILRKVA